MLQFDARTNEFVSFFWMFTSVALSLMAKKILFGEIGKATRNDAPSDPPTISGLSPTNKSKRAGCTERIGLLPAALTTNPSFSN